MFTRRNWLLRCSILINVAVILYLCSHVLIGGVDNLASSSAFITQEQQQQLQQLLQLQSKVEEINAGESSPQKEELIVSTSDDKPQQQDVVSSNVAAEPPSPLNDNDPARVNVAISTPSPAPNAKLQNQEDSAAELDPNIGDPAGLLGNAGGSAESNSYTNNTNADGGFIVTGDEKDINDRLRSILKCHDRAFEPETLQRGDFWVLKNYVRAEHGEIKCHETITYTTHADYTFLDNLIPLLDRWRAPISIAMYAPGTDFQPTIDSIRFLRSCLPDSQLVRMFTTFHIYFGSKHIPKTVPKHTDILKAYNCSLTPPFVNVSTAHMYKTQKKLLYPVNVGRNIARDAALTYFILASDIELYPNPGLVKRFLEMIARNEPYLQRKSPRVFPLSIFEVDANSVVPRDKTELQELLRSGKAIPFHKRVCAICHNVPKAKEWIEANETDELSVFHIGKRMGAFVHWEPIYIGTHADPHYDERLSWEGKSDKMTQGYTLCVLNYEFHILDNAFLVHKPGIKQLKRDNRRAVLANKTNHLISKIIYPELKIMYGIRKGCAV